MQEKSECNLRGGNCGYDSSSRSYSTSEPSPIAKVALNLNAQYRAQAQSNITPIEVQEGNWDIAFHPTEKVQVLSRKGNSRGLVKEVARTPSWKK